MEISKGLRPRPRYRRRRALRGSRRAVVSVVGTLLSLLVFFALFGIFVTQYVPLWMSDNESLFTSQMQSSLAELKSNIDLQTDLGGPLVFSTPFTLASEGIPLIAQPTLATMNYVPHTQGVYLNVTESYGPGGKPDFSLNTSLGSIQTSLPNRYFPAQEFVYENDAVIESQGDTNQVLLYPPPFVVNDTGHHMQGSFELLQLYGNATQIVSSGTVEVFSHFDNVQLYPSNGTGYGGIPPPGTPFQVSITVGTLYPCAWATYFNQTMAASGLTLGSNYTLSPASCVGSSGHSTAVRLTLLDMNAFDLILASFVIQIGVGHS